MQKEDVAPASGPSLRVVILTADRKNDAETLASAVILRARNSAPRAASIEVVNDACFLRCPLRPGDPNTVAVILSGGAITATDTVIAGAATDCLKNMIPVLPIFDPKRGACTKQMPAAIHPINGLAWDGSHPIERAAELVLKLLGISEEDQRVFISYRQVDAAAMADQIRKGLIDGAGTSFSTGSVSLQASTFSNDWIESWRTKPLFCCWRRHTLLRAIGLITK